MTVITRETRETSVRVAIGDSASEARIETTVPFLDHMLVTFSRYANLRLDIKARGDLPHHLVEDTAIALGGALAKSHPPGIARFGDRTIPMDDALVHVSLDIGGRPWYEGKLPARLYDHWFQSFAANARATLHVRELRGHDRHHVVEAAFKALGLALRDALAEAEAGTVFSTKGDVRWDAGALPAGATRR